MPGQEGCMSKNLVNGSMMEALRRGARVPSVRKQQLPIEITRIETIQAERPEDISVERVPIDQMSNQQLKRMGFKEIERKLKAMYPGVGRQLIRTYARYQLSEAWKNRDKVAVRKAINENDAKGVGIGMRPL
jgi:hypothetical protein